MTYDMKRRAVLPTAHFSLYPVILFICFIFIAVLFLLPVHRASAKSTARGDYQVVSVRIEPGDSLWAIASEYYSAECGPFRSYISEIKRMNGMTGDTIYADHYLLVPYYAE